MTGRRGIWVAAFPLPRVFRIRVPAPEPVIVMRSAVGRCEEDDEEEPPTFDERLEDGLEMMSPYGDGCRRPRELP